MLDVVTQKIPIFRQPGIYGYLVAQLNLLKLFDGQYYLEWFLPEYIDRQTNIHLTKKVTKKDLQKLFLNTPLNQLSLFDIFNPVECTAYNNLKIGPSVDDAYYKNAIFKPIKRKFIKDRLDTIVNEPLQSPNNVALMSTPDLKTMIQ